VETEASEKARLAAQAWQARLAADVGARIARFRREKGMTGQALADECAKLHVPFDRAVISKLEKGNRQTLTIGDLLVLARALDVPPLLLLFPLGHADEVEVLPGVTDATWIAAKHFIGENGPEAPGVVDLFRDHEHYFRRFMESYRGVVKVQNEDLDEADKRYEVMRRDDVPPLRRTRQMIRQQGLTPPPMPEGIPAYFGFDLDEGIS
jgi:transcriptional regulator with XRE-family HTH domain